MKKTTKPPAAKSSGALVPHATGPKTDAGAAVRRAGEKTSRLSRRSPLDIKTPRGYFGDQIIANRERMHLEPAELKAFFKSISAASFWYPYFYIQYFFGCRLSEPALILDEDVCARQIIIRRLKNAKEESGFREHTYAIDPRVLEAVKSATAWKEAKKVTENPFLFPSTRSRKNEDVGAERLSQLRNIGGWQAVSRFTAHRMFCDIAVSAHIPPNLQQSAVLRHTRAVVLLSSGQSPDEVMRQLGHSSMKMTSRYMYAAEAARGKYDAAAVGKVLAL